MDQFADIIEDLRRKSKEYLEGSKEKLKNHPKMNAPATWSLNDFDVGGLLGSGGFGDVNVAREKLTGHVVALKSIPKKNTIQTEDISEIKINASLKHPNILTMFAYFEQPSKIYLVLEYAGNGDLFECMQRQPNARFTEKLAAKYMQQITDAVLYCHQRSIIHRDIKLENILITHHDDVKLADFGCAVRSRGPLKSVCGTPEYFAPELVNNYAYGKKVDNWSLGVVCYELVVGDTPFNGKNRQEMFEKIRTLDFTFPPHLSAEARNLISGLLRSSRLRLSLSRVRNHPWIKKELSAPV